MPFKNFYTDTDLKTVQDNAALNLEWLLKDASTRAEIDAALSKAATRNVVKNALRMFRPGIEVTTFRLCEAERESEALALVESALIDLFDEDPIIFQPVPTREEMLSLALAAHAGIPATDHWRATLWKSFCDRAENLRLADAYKFRHQIAERGAVKLDTAPNRTRDGGLIDGGAVARVAVEATT